MTRTGSSISPLLGVHDRDKKILSSEHIHLAPRDAGWLVTPKSKQNKKNAKARVNFVFYSTSSFQYLEERDRDVATTKTIDVQDAKKKLQKPKRNKVEWTPEDLPRTAFDDIVTKLQAAPWMKTWLPTAIADNTIVNLDIGPYTFQPAGKPPSIRNIITRHGGAPLAGAITQFNVQCPA